MLTLTEKAIRESFVNASRKEVSDLTLPEGFGDIDWDRLDYLGWRDRKIARRAYVVVPSSDGMVGILLKRAEATPRARAQCSWCQDVQLPNDVVLYAAKRSGQAGRNGNTVGTLVCADFECSSNVRKLPPLAYVGFDRDAAREERIARLQVRAAGFAGSVLE
ncbi:FBP domain-containing protein [Diaminobutyricibacter sp. McL0618]|uniref:FBP domain-containing protein n=1 Tax=Leifsonia sp. McL0618 TaxID=3415677 RepID=UPI003CF1124A